MSSPERDRQLARRVRHGWRRAESVAHALDGLLSSEAMRTARRFRHVTAVLDAEIAPPLRAKVRATGLVAGVLTIEVADSTALAELRATAQHRLLAALASAGTGTTQLRWRVRSAR